MCGGADPQLDGTPSSKQIAVSGFSSKWEELDLGLKCAVNTGVKGVERQLFACPHAIQEMAPCFPTAYATIMHNHCYDSSLLGMMTPATLVSGMLNQVC